MSRPNPIEGIEPSEVFQASCQSRTQWINGIAMNYHYFVDRLERISDSLYVNS